LLRDEQSRKVLPKNPIGLAISYEQALWEDLGTHTGDGDLSIDNNVSERSLRAQAEHAGRVRCNEGSGILRRLALLGLFTEATVLSGPTLLKEPPGRLCLLDQRAIDPNDHDLFRNSRLLQNPTTRIGDE
jgi:Transposase IS66 family